MNNPNVLNGIILLFVAIVSVCLWWIHDQVYLIKFWKNQALLHRELFTQTAEELAKTKDNPLVSVPAEVVHHIRELETENATLRTDVETGCRTIEKMQSVLKGQKETINRLVIENRRFLRQFGRIL